MIESPFLYLKKMKIFVLGVYVYIMLQYIAGPKRNCPVCDKSIHKSSLKRHIRTVHTENFNIQCPDCHKKFKNLESLDSHRRLTHRITVSAAAAAAAAATSHVTHMESLSQRLLEGFLKPAFGIQQD